MRTFCDTDLSYLELVDMLVTDVESDKCIPAPDRNKATALLQELHDLLWKYSA